MTTSTQQHKIRAVVYGVLAVSMAGATGWLAFKTLSSYEARLRGAEVSGEARPVVVATHDLRPGITLTVDDLKVEPREVRASDGVVYQGPDELLGKMVGDRVFAGEPIRAERLVVGGATPLVNEIMDPGARAMTIRANRAAAVGGLLRPGFFVDVIVTMRPDTDVLSADWVTDTILQGRAHPGGGRRGVVQPRQRDVALGGG